jgi:hypothetical protein
MHDDELFSRCGFQMWLIDNVCDYGIIDLISPNKTTLFEFSGPSTKFVGGPVCLKGGSLSPH